MQKDGGGGLAPTGCFKCGRPGHWSRDCPSSASANPYPNPGSYQRSSGIPSRFPHGTAKTTPGKGATLDGESAPATATAKRLTKTRPKLTPELLLSEDGLGYVLRHFPKAFKYHGRGHEARDLGKLISLYVQWHSHLIPYYSFNQFIQKVEQVGCTRRVRMCLRELRDRVANGGDPTKLHQPPKEDETPDCEPAAELPVLEKDDAPTERNDINDLQEEMFDEIYRNATEERPQSVPKEKSHTFQSAAISETNPENGFNVQASNKGSEDGPNHPRTVHVTEEQKARMEANRLKALERTAARARASES